jgi:regulatory protein
LRRITSIVPSARRPGRFEITFDDRTAATVSIDAVDKLRLGVGGLVDERVAREIAREEAIVNVYDRALNILALRGRSSQELRRRLVQKGEEPAIVDVALERLLQAGFLDDASFARQFARTKALGAGLSRRRLKQELARKGIPAPMSEEAIADVYVEEQIDETAAIERVARKKLKSLAKLDEATQRRRLFAHLARRGYDMDDISRVSRQLLPERSSD